MKYLYVMYILVGIVAIVPLTRAEAGVLEERRMERIVSEYGCTIQSAVYEFGLPTAPSIIAGMMAVESSGKPHAVSSSNARGLLQLKHVALEQVRAAYPETLFSDDLHDPRNNIRVAVAYFSYLKYEYRNGMAFGDDSEVMMAYNRGPVGALRAGTERPFDDRYVSLIYREAKRTPPILCPLN